MIKHFICKPLHSVLLASILLGVLCITNACQKPTKDIKMTHINASPDTPELSLLMDNVAMMHNTPYMNTNKNYIYYNKSIYENNTADKKLEVKSTYTWNLFNTTTAALYDYNYYTVVNGGSIIDMKTFVFEDVGVTDFTIKSRIRFINMCPDCGEVTVKLSGNTFVSKIPYGASNGKFVETLSDTMICEIFDSAGAFITMDRGYIYENAKIYNIVLSGYKNPSSATYNPTVFTLPYKFYY